MNEQVQHLTKELDECKKRIQREKSSTTRFFKFVESSAQVNNKLKIDLDSIVKENNNLKIELENERKNTAILKI